MSLLWVEGFDWLGSSGAPNATLFGYKYSTVVTDLANTAIAAGREGRYCLANKGSFCFRPPITSGSGTTITVGFAFKTAAACSTTKEIFRVTHSDGYYYNFRLGDNLTSMSLYLGTSLAPGVDRDNKNTSKVDYVCSRGVWQYIEFQEELSTGINIVRVNGVEKFYKDTYNTGASVASIAISVPGNGVNDPSYIDDVYVCNSVGAVNNTFLGPCVVGCMRPAADDAGNSDWAPNSGAVHYDRVNTNPSDADTAYLESATSTDQDLWTYQAPTPPTRIHGIQLNTDFKRDATPGAIYTPILSNGTQDDGTQYSGLTSYTTVPRISVTDPATGAAWEKIGLTAAQFGIKVV